MFQKESLWLENNGKKSIAICLVGGVIYEIFKTNFGIHTLTAF
jgi:hypothetical protein